ncbi:MAG TPA: hypothetical protein PLU49_13090, partial [Saprospiraceae bacterium]|nr:hypothetical protein [Saprospiraceae bacterium]
RARLARAEDLVTYISGFENYGPPRPEETIESMKALIRTLFDVNANVAARQKDYSTAVDVRFNAFWKVDNSVQKLIVQIRAAVEAQFGKKSTEAAIVNRIIKRMREIRIRKAPANLETPAGQTAASRSDRKFGTLTHFFNDIVTTIENTAGYDSTNERVKKQTLKDTAANLSLLNAEVAKKEQELKSASDHRLLQYAELKLRADRIKAYVKGFYGMKSQEYELIKGMRF